MNYNYYLPFERVTKFVLLLLFTVNLSTFAEGADDGKIITQFKIHEKGKFFVTWGYNRSMYDKSDIHFTGQGHDFILYDVVANDRPSKLSLDYINPSTWSIPQFNFRVGYYISDKYSVSVGWDHMKYVAVDYQSLKMYGYLDPTKVPDQVMQANMEKMNSVYAPNGLYNNTQVIMEPATFLSYEHTDGFNYATVDLERHDKLWQYSKHDRLGVSFMSGIGFGTIVPRTDSRLFGSGRNHFWNFAGWGANAKIGIQVNLSKVIYLESDLKYGYVQMLNIHTSNHYNIDRAQQDIVFYENNWLIGFRF